MVRLAPAAVLALVLTSGSLDLSRAEASRSIYFFKNPGVEQQPEMRPSQIVFAADGNEDVTGLRWTAWGSSVARAVGTNQENDCEPTCAEGSIKGIPAHVTLSKPGRFRGREMYLCYRVYYTVRTSGSGFRGCLNGYFHRG